VPTLAAFFVLRAILDAASGQHPLPSILAAMFLLGTQTTYNLIQSYNTGTQYATVDVLDSLWNHLVGTVTPQHIYKMAASGQLPSFRVAGAVRFDPQDLAHWLTKKVPPPGLAEPHTKIG
jgi:Helix-turn-helix domain